MAEGPKQVTAWQGYGIYADYDANAPDSEDRLFVATEELAQQVCAKLNENPRAHGDLAYCEGWEWCKSFQYHEVILLDKSAFATSLDELELEGDSDCATCSCRGCKMDEIPCSVCTHDWKCPFPAARFYRVRLQPLGPRGRQEWTALEARCEFHRASGGPFEEITQEQFMLESVHEG